jgi:hypothetical protein
MIYDFNSCSDRKIGSFKLEVEETDVQETH